MDELKKYGENIYVNDYEISVLNKCNIDVTKCKTLAEVLLLIDRYLDDSNSVTINQVTQKMLLALPIPLPPHQEQHRIVAKIEELFAQLDKIEASL